MNAFQLQGAFNHYEIFTTANKKEIVTIFVEVSGYGDKKVLIPVKGFGEVVTAAKGLTPGRGVFVQGHLDGREASGKHYPEIIADKVVHAVQTTSKKLGADPEPMKPQHWAKSDSREVEIHGGPGDDGYEDIPF